MSTIIDQTFTAPPPSGSDDVPGLLNWLETVPDGAGDDGQGIRHKNQLVFGGALGADWHLNTPFHLYNRHDLVFTFENQSSWARAVDLLSIPVTEWTHCTQLEFNDPLVVGRKATAAGYLAAREHEASFWFESCTDILLTHPMSQHCWGDHFYAGKHAGDPTWCDGITIINPVCGSSGRDALALTSARNVKVTGGSFAGCRTCIDLEPNGSVGGVSDVTVDGVQFRSHTGDFLAAMSGGTEGTVDRVNVTNCTVTAGDLQAVVSGGASRSCFTMVGNKGTVPVGNGRGTVQQYDGVSGFVTVTGNSNPVESGRNMHFAGFTSCPTVTYTGNTPQ